MRGGRFTVTQRGFTLPEVLALCLVTAVAGLAALWFINPADYTARANNAERWTGTAQLLQAFGRYHADHGALPPGITAQQQLIGSDKGMLDLCQALVPRYLKDVPLDPVEGTELAQTDCRDKDAAYVTGYTVRQAEDGTVIVEAPAAEGQEKIRQVRKYK